MKMIFIGTGSAFTVGHHNYHSNILLEHNNQHFLVDCGSDARLALHELGFSYRDINNVYISHLHADHAGGLEWLGFCRKFDTQCKKPHLYISKLLVEPLWNHVLSGGLSSLHGVAATLPTYFDVHAVPESNMFEWEKIPFKLIRTIHIMHGFSSVPSYGLFFEVDGKKIFISTDTQFHPDHYAQVYEQADIIFHDCEIAECASGVHSNFNDLCTLDPSIKKKMWLYHYNQNSELPDARKAGFRGFVRKGQCFDLSDPGTL